MASFFGNIVLILLVNMTSFELAWANSQSYSLDTFRVNVNTKLDKQQSHRFNNLELNIHHEDRPDFSIWSINGNSPFIEAFSAEEKVKNSRSSFQFKRKIRHHCKNPFLQNILHDDEKLTLTGSFHDCPQISYEFIISSPQRNELSFSARIFDEKDDRQFNHIRLTYGSHKSELFYGFGEQYFDYNAKGRILPIWLQEQGHGRGLEPLSTAMKLTGSGPSAGNWWSTYSAIPSYLTNQGRGLCLDNTEYLTFDLRADDEVTVDVWSKSISGRIFFGPTPLESLEQLTAYTGRMLPIPSWTQEGIILRLYGGQDQVRETLDEAKRAGLKVAGVWIEDWVGHRSTLIAERLWWNWEPARNLYPDWPELVQELNDRGIKVLIYFNPYLSDVSRAEHSFSRNLFAEAAAEDFFVRDRNGKMFAVKAGLFTGNIMDLTNPDARDFLKSLMREQLEIGVSGWMADFGEAIPYNAVMHSGEKGRSFHNLYANEWSKLTSETIREAGLEGQAFSFHRSGSLKSPQYNSMFWTGDQIANWDKFDGLGTIVPALTSAGLSGWALSHSDIGGFMAANFVLFKYKRSKELLIRWLELNTFTAMMRTHTSNQPDLSHQWNSDPETTALFVKMTGVFQALKDYRKGLIKEAHERGYPLVRHPMLHFPDDPQVHRIKQQFMLGDQFWIAPVIEKGKNSVETYLPKGRWTHLWSGKEYHSKGEYFNIFAPLGQPSVFYKAGSAAGKNLRSELEKKGYLVGTDE